MYGMVPQSEWRQMSRSETAAIDGVDCSYINMRTGQVIPPWQAPGATPEFRAQTLANYRASVARSGGQWNPFPDGVE